MTVAAAPALDVGAALARGRTRCLRQQDPAGWWKGELETNVTMDAEDLLLREFLGIRTPAVTRRAAALDPLPAAHRRHLGDVPRRPGRPSTTIEAYVALRLAGDPVDAAHMQQAAAFVRDAGGIEARPGLHPDLAGAVRPVALGDAAHAAAGDRSSSRRVPAERLRLRCWARQTIVPLTIVALHRPVHPLPFSLDELRRCAGAHGQPVARRGRSTAGSGCSTACWHRYDRRPFRSLRRSALAAAERWILARQEADGSLGRHPAAVGLLAPRPLATRLPARSPRDARRPGRPRGVHDRRRRGRRLEACQSPVWDTALAVVALADAGVAARRPGPRAGGRLAARRRGAGGRRLVGAPSAARHPADGRSSSPTTNYPDIDDTAEVVLALRRGRASRRRPGRRRHRTGGAPGWTACSAATAAGAPSTSTTPAAPAPSPVLRLRRGDDPPSADVTAHVLEMLAAETAADPRPTRRGVAWLAQQQEPDGSWFGRWGANHVYGTGAAVPALRATGTRPRTRRRCRPRSAGWRRTRTPTAAGARTSGPTTTSLARAAGPRPRRRPRGPCSRSWPPASARTRRAEECAWLVATQRADGTWDEPWFTGTGFPGDFSINYHLYRLVFPVMALGRFVHGADAPTGAAR